MTVLVDNEKEKEEGESKDQTLCLNCLSEEDDCLKYTQSRDRKSI